jgi:undecaprenyl-diphosphatase
MGAVGFASGSDLDILHACLIAVLQGATELFPVSSLGHAVVVPALLGWRLDEYAASFLPFLVLLHLGTAAALLLYFWHDWLALAAGCLGFYEKHRARESRYIVLLLVIATIPAVLLGAGLEHVFLRLFGSPVVAAGFLAVNGLLLLAGERLRGKAADGPARPIASLTMADALVIGMWQCLALFPGISRSGATIVGGLLRGIDHAAAARFSFLIATPIILGATAREVPKLLHAGVPAGMFETASIAAVVAGVVAFASTAFLMRYFAHNDKWALNPFAYYCLAAGLISAGLLMAGLHLSLA